jgi:hypothetical protein
MNDHKRFSDTPSPPRAGVNAKKIRRRVTAKALATPGQAWLLAGFADGMEKRVAAISHLDPEIDQKDIERIQKIDSYVQSLARNYLSTGKLPDWSKSLSKDIKQFFRLRHLLSQPHAQVISIRLGHKVAEAALSAPRGPADYLAGVIMRTLKALDVNTELAFNLEFVHGACRENHPLHIHGVLCVPDDQLPAVVDALTRALAAGYRARWKNVAVLLERPQSPGFWASYCIKESTVTAETISRNGGRPDSTSYATRTQTRDAKAYYERIDEWVRMGSL